MQQLESSALVEVNRQLGSTKKGAAKTEFEDGILVQSYDVGGAVRRGRTQAGTTGMYHAGLRNIHAGAGDLTNQVDPYNLDDRAANLNVAPFPGRLGPDFDIWLLSTSLRRISGTGTIAATLSLNWSAGVAFGVNDSGAAVAPSGNLVVAWWDTVTTVVNVFGLEDGAHPWQKIGIRIPRNVMGPVQLLFTTTASALSTYECEMLLGVFPVGAGQDGIT